MIASKKWLLESIDKYETFVRSVTKDIPPHIELRVKYLKKFLESELVEATQISFIDFFRYLESLNIEPRNYFSLTYLNADISSACEEIFKPWIGIGNAEKRIALQIILKELIDKKDSIDETLISLIQSWGVEPIEVALPTGTIKHSEVIAVDTSRHTSYWCMPWICGSPTTERLTPTTTAHIKLVTPITTADPYATTKLLAQSPLPSTLASVSFLTGPLS